MAGIGGPYSTTGWIDTNTRPANPFSQYGDPASFAAGAGQQASDYDKIMQSYGDVVANASANPISPKPVVPTTTPFAQSVDVTGSLANLSNLSQTGGYTAQGKADILARDISPTRSIYANAQQDLQRSKALSGGYSPNTAAATAQMARDESGQIGGINTAANAGIAQNVAANELTASGQYAGAAENAQAQSVAANQRNADILNQTGEFNTAEGLQAQEANKSNILAGVGGATNLYGTTPALTSTFGNQVSNATQLGQNQQQIDEQKRRDIFSMAS